MIAFARPDQDDEDEVENQEGALLDSIRTAPWCWSRVDDLVAAGHDEETLDALVERGLLDRWDLPEEPPGPRVPPSGRCVTFSALAVERLGVTVLEEGHVERPRWAWPSEVPRYVQTWRRLYGIEFPEQIIDPAPGPEEELLMAESFDLGTGQTILEPVRLFMGASESDQPEPAGGLRGGIGAGRSEVGATVVIDRRLGKRKSKSKDKAKRRKPPVTRARAG